MNTFSVWLLLCLNIIYQAQACSLPKCPPGTQQCIVGRGGADCSGVLGCLKVCPPGAHHIGPLVPNQCNGRTVQSPFDVCNRCGCENGLVRKICTSNSCSRGQKQKGELCGSDLNNCAGGLSCIWDGQGNNVGICKDSAGSQAKITMTGSDGYNIPKVTITFSNGIVADVIITDQLDSVPADAQKGELCFLNGVVDNQFGSSVKLIGCLPTANRHEADQMTIILKAATDSGWYSLYYATEHDTTITVKKIRNKPNVKVITQTPPPPSPPPPPFSEQPLLVTGDSPTHLTEEFLEKFPPPPSNSEEEDDFTQDEGIEFDQDLVNFSY